MLVGRIAAAGRLSVSVETGVSMVHAAGHRGSRSASSGERALLGELLDRLANAHALR